MGVTSNLLAHIKLHKLQSKDMADRINAFSSVRVPKNKIMLDEKVSDFLMFYVATASATILLDNEYFKNVLHYKIGVSNY